MSFDPLTALFEAGKMAIERIWPDPIKRAEEMRKLEEIRDRGDARELDAHVKLMLGQISINMKEAEHKSLFVAGWRPFIGWVCGFSIAYQFIIYPMLTWIWAAVNPTYINAEGVRVALSAPPVLDTGTLMTLVMSMLGVGIMRSVDKRNRVQTDVIGSK